MHATSKPLFILGGFGGCSRDLAESLQLSMRVHAVKLAHGRGGRLPGNFRSEPS
ncbi:hypothetical protein [Sinorhizobium meliloti]|uniref:hypothetical protein n=1 Tax=Rhizobium meliloti TaxID=382 RepID=UPI003DA04380